MMEAGAWQVMKSLGKGGMSEIYLALDPSGRKVAVKTLKGGIGSSIFEEEAKLLIRLHHPALVSILGYRVRSDEIFQEDKGPCFWMEFVEGEDLLSAAIEKDAASIFEWLKEALQALQYL